MVSKAEKLRKKRATRRVTPTSRPKVVVAAKPERAAVVIEREALAVRMAETVQLEAQRNEMKPAKLPSDGPVRLRSRDGLATLLASGAITEAQAQAGLAFRVCFEAAAAGLRIAALADRVSGGKPVGADVERARLLNRLNQFETAVSKVMRDGRELLALRMVAGEGRTVRSLAAGGNARDAYVAALCRALDAVAELVSVRPLANRGPLAS